MGGGALGGAMQAIGSGAKAAGSDIMGTAKNALFGIQHPMQTAENGVPNATDNYENSTIGKLFGAGQPGPQMTPAQRNRMMQAQQG